MYTLSIDKVDESLLYLHANDSVLREIWEYFSFFAKNYRHMPKYKMGIWDGKIRLFNINAQTIHSGLIHELIKFAQENNYQLDIDPDIHLSTPKDPVWHTEVATEINSFNLPFTPHDYQVRAIETILKHRKRLVLSPTSSGKSLIIYSAIRMLLNDPDKPRKVLLVVPTTSLVEQMAGDFSDYSENNEFDVDSQCHKIYSGKSKSNKKPVTITTWQSVYKLGAKWFSEFDAVFVDEAHLASSDSIISLMEKCVNAEFRIGLTGTIEDTQTHKLTLVGLFGRVYETISTRELMDRGLVSQLSIKSIIFNHPDNVCQKVSGMAYEDEIDFIISDPIKNKFYCNLALKQQGNTLVLFNFTDRHGKPLYELMTSMNKSGKTIFYVDGDTPTEERERIRLYTENNDDVVIIASYGTFSTGISIKNLENAIFAHPFKSKIKILQSIGRVLRKSSKSDSCTLFDIASDFTYKSKVNTTMGHFKERLKLYDKAKFNNTMIRVRL